MKITKLTPQILSNYSIQSQANTTQSQPQDIAASEKLPSANAALAMSYHPNFTGGYSLNLADTITNLDKLAAKYSDVYPKNVREWAGMILEEGNKGKETLISIHKKLYQSIKDCFSLDELKAKFPEFKDVKPSASIEAKEGSLFDDLQKGNLEYFTPDEDLSLQIIKLYWGEGFSLNDLKAYTGGKDLNYVMNRLNIPKVNRHYGHILKFSDPEYNERLTKQMTLKRMETMDRKAQKLEGEPVHIKRGPLSAEHRQHISEGLSKYYQENPERIFAMSERQKKFYEDNPEQSAILHRVMVKAWSVFGADNIKKAMANFMKKNGIKDFKTDELDYPNKLSQQKSALMKKFWANNEWAKKSFSKNMTYAWKKVKEEQNMFYKIDLTPELFKKRFFIWCEKEGIDTADLSFDNFKYYPHKPELNELDSSKISQYTPKYIDSCPGDESQKIANSYQMTLIKFGHILKDVEKTNASSDTKDLAKLLRRIIHSSLFDNTQTIMGMPTARSLDAQEVQHIYVTVATRLMDYHENKLIRKLVDTLNESYNYLDKNWKAGEPMMLPTNADKF